MTQGRPPISGRTRFYGIFADPIGHVQSPAAFNALLDRRGVDAVFVPLHVPAEHFAAAVAGMRHLRSFAGYTLTMPHKTMAVHQCDELLPNARACGAVNAVRIDPEGRLIGEIYDGVGMVTAITAHRTLDATTRVLLVGAGGAGRAIAVAIALAGVGHLVIANRTQDKADDLAETVRRAVPACAVEAGTAVDPAAFDLVINATSLGLNGQGPMPVDVSRLSGTALVADVVTVPEFTPLLQAAQARGLGIVCGREMLTQGVEAIADFLGMTADE
jgi:shikimate dehydrogenase